MVGATGFWIISDGKASAIDCVYMVFITVAILGIATMGYMLSKLTIFIVEASSTKPCGGAGCTT